MTEDKDYVKLIVGARQDKGYCSYYAVHCEGWQPRENWDLCNSVWRMLARNSPIQKTKGCSRKSEATTHCSHCRKEVCEKFFSRWLGTKANLYVQEAMKVPEAKATVNKALEKPWKIPAWDERKGKSKLGVFRREKKDANTVHFANLWTPCLLKRAELARHLQKYKEPVVLWEGHCHRRRRIAVLTEPGVSASPKAAATFLDAVSMLRGLVGEASDAVSTYAQVKMTYAPKFLRMPKEERIELWITVSSRRRPKSWENIEEPLVPLGRNLYGHPWARFLWERNFGEVLFEKGMEESTCTGNVFTCTSKTVIQSGAKLSARKLCWNRRRRQNRKHHRRFVVYEWRINVSTPWWTSCEALGPREWNIHDPIEIRRRSETKLRRVNTKSLNILSMVYGPKRRRSVLLRKLGVQGSRSFVQDLSKETSG